QDGIGRRVEKGVDATAPVGREHGGDTPEDEADGRPAEPDYERDAGAEEQPAEDVPIEIVGAEEVPPPGGTVLGRREVLEVRVGEWEQVGEDGHDDDQPDPAGADPEEGAQFLLG